jgi:ABC-type branched-subunit amino acid transport system permease subunit
MMKPPATTLVRRIPWVLVVFVAALTIPWVGTRYDTFLATQIAISALFAMSLNLLLGTTGLVSFGHVAYFGIGSYVCGILMKTYAVPFAIALRGGGRRPWRAGVRLLLRAPHQDLLCHADTRLLPDRLGDLLQME